MARICKESCIICLKFVENEANNITNLQFAEKSAIECMYALFGINVSFCAIQKKLELLSTFLIGEFDL